MNLPFWKKKIKYEIQLSKPCPTYPPPSDLFHHPTFTEKIHSSLLVISIDTNENLEVLKNRHGSATEGFGLGRSTTFWLIGKIISSYVLKTNNESLKLFRESIEQEVRVNLENILEKHSVKEDPCTHTTQTLMSHPELV